MPRVEINIPAGQYVVTVDDVPSMVTVLPSIGLAGGNAAPGPVLMLDGQSVNDLNLPYLDASYWTSNNNGTITVDVVVTRDVLDVPQPSSLTEEYEQGRTIRLEITVSDGTGSVDYTVDMSVYPVPAAVVDSFGSFSYTQGSGVQSVPFETFFEASSPSENWVAADLSYVLLNAPTGVSLGSGTVQFDTDVLTAQTGRTVSLRASDTVTVDGVSTVRSVTAEITFDIVANAITLSELPRVGDAASEQLFVGEAVVDFSNHDIIIDDDPDLWTGLGNPGFRVFRTRRNGGASEILTLVAEQGDVIRPIADGYVDTRTPGDGLGGADAIFHGNDVTVANYLTFSTDQDARLLTLDVNPNVPAGRALVGLEISGQPVLPGIVPADFVLTDQMKQLTAPALSFAVDGALGDDLVYAPPAIIAPTGATVTWTFDLINSADQSVILADQTIANNEIRTELTAGLQGLTVFWRAKARAAGLPDLDIDSSTVDVPAAVVTAYTTKLFRSNGAHLRNLNDTFVPMAVNNGLVTMAFSMEHHGDGQLFRQGNLGALWVRVVNGQLFVDARDDADRFWQAETDDLPAGLNQYYIALDAANQTQELRINGALATLVRGNTVDANAGTFRDVGVYGIFARENSEGPLDATFQELFVEFGALHPYSAFAPDAQGNLPDLRTFGNPQLLLGTGDQSAAELNAAQNRASSAGALVLETTATGFTEV